MAAAPDRALLIAGRDEANSDFRYPVAAELSYQLGSQTGDANDYIDAAVYSLLAENYPQAEALCSQIVQAGVKDSVRLFRTYAFSLLFQDKHKEASELFGLLLSLGPSNDWAKQFAAASEESARLRLAKAPGHLVTIERLDTVGRDNVLHYVLRARCPECRMVEEHQVPYSMFRLEFVPCRRCMFPRVTTPRLLSRALRKRAQFTDPEGLLALDQLLWSWSNHWFKRRDAPKEAFTARGTKLFDVCRFSIRTGVGDLYHDAARAAGEDPERWS